MNSIEEIDLNISKVKDLLGYLIEQDYAIDITKKVYKNTYVENYWLKETYHNTYMFLDIIFDYILSTQEIIDKYINGV